MKSIYTPDNYWGDLRNDMWMLNLINQLPQNPPTIQEQVGNTTVVKMEANICIDVAREAVEKYRNQLAPIVFTLTQKIYAELFRLVLGDNGETAGNTQNDVEKVLNKLLQTNSASLVVTPTFKDQAEFEDWWQGQYNYNKLRRVRNQIMHKYHYFDGTIMKFEEDDGAVLLRWTPEDVFAFADRVLAKARVVGFQ